MDKLLQVDWKSIFVPAESFLELFIRTSIVYLGLFFLLRVLAKREAGELSVTDFLLIALIGDALQNAMTDDYKTVWGGFVVVGTILFWNYFINYVTYRFPFMERMLRPAPLLLVRDGVMNRRNMRREFISEEELLSALREEGIDELSKVKYAYMEPDGRISAATLEDAPSQPKTPDRKDA